jgi:hypothetical protein
MIFSAAEGEKEGWKDYYYSTLFNFVSGLVGWYGVCGLWIVVK